MRSLAIVCFSFSAAVFAANYLLPLPALPYVSLFSFLLGLGVFLLYRRWFLRAVLCLWALCFGFGFFWLHAQRTTVQAQELEGEILTVSVRLLSYPVSYEDYCRAEVQLCTPDLPRLKALLYDNSMALAEASPGELLRMEARLRPAGSRYGEPYEHDHAKGIYLVLNSSSEPGIDPAGSALRRLPLKLNRAVTEHISAVFPADTAPFVRSLLLGDKSELYQQPGQYRHISRAGLAHVVAVSGMHLAYLLGFFQRLLGKSRRNTLFAIGIIWCFVLISGASPSAVRAGTMQSIFLMAPVFRRENDTATTVSVALAAILLCNPHAAGSVSLQLSFGAMAGILIWGQGFRDRLSAFLEGKCVPLSGFLANTVSISAAGMIFTVPLAAIHFQTVNLFSVLSNILVLWAVSFCFVGSYLACGLALLLPAVGEALAWLISWPVRYILFVARTISLLPLSVIHLQDGLSIAWLILSYLLFVLAALSRLRLRYKLLLPLGLSLSLLLVNTCADALSYRSAKGVITALDVGQGQCVTVFAGDQTLMVDCGGLGTLDNAGDTASAYLSSCGRSGVDLLILTHLHADHANGVVNLLEMQKVQTLILPENPDDADGVLSEVLDAAGRHGVELVHIGEDSSFSLGDLDISLFIPQNVGSINERGLIVKLSLGDYDAVLTGDASSYVERKLVKEDSLGQAELLFVGHHGSKYSSCGDYLKYLDGETAVISCGYNTYGHPTHQVLERLAAYGYNIYRTDLNGNIEIRLG